MKYICPVLLTILIVLIVAIWLIPREAEWQATQFRICTEMEMKEKTYDYTDAEDIEKTLAEIFNGPCREYFDGYMRAIIDANTDYRKIAENPDSLKVVRGKFEAMALAWLSTLYLNVPPAANLKRHSN